ncbi:MAG TPA: hypothetical protein VNO81_04865 [Candidatus Nitrosotenuis sp.]|jgi:hypothetical protein|nr:hypothetical protein [Candidatus Nitrosotenuis sp.]
MLVGETITLEYKMSPGENLRYRTVVESAQRIREEGSPDMYTRRVLEMGMRQAVKEVSGGLMTVDVIIESGEIREEGQSMQLPTVGSVITITMKKTGEITKSSVDFPFSQPAFPERSLKVNDSWTGQSHMEIPLTDPEGNVIGKKPVTLNYHYTLAGFERVAGYECAVIKVSCPKTVIPVQEGIEQQITASGATYFAHREGRLIKSNVDTETRISAPGADVKTQVKVAVELTDAPPPASSGPSPLGGSDEQFIIGA